MTTVSVILPFYNDFNAALRAVSTLSANAANPSQIEWLIQDDASPETDFSGALAGVLTAGGNGLPRMTIERNTVNLGFGQTCNAGAARSSGDILLFLNQDVYADTKNTPAWDLILTESFNELALDVAGCRLLFPDGSIQSVGGAFDLAGQPTHLYLGGKNPDSWRVNRTAPVDWVTGAALAIRRTAWERLGGFDERYHMYFEDVDLCVRARIESMSVHILPPVTFYHEVGSTGGSVHFMDSAKKFKARWLDTHSRRIEASVLQIRENFWIPRF